VRPACLLGAFAFTVFAARATGAAPAPPPPPGREISLSPSEVKDTFFAYVLGIIRAGVELDIDNADMRAILVEFKTPLAVPFDLIDRVTQREGPDGKRTIGLDFSRDVDIPIPFSLLWYHPGSIVSTRDVTFSVDRGTWADPRGSPVAPVFVLSLSEGSILIDVDDWLEVLFGAYIEDTYIRHLVFFTYRGDWIGLLEGSGRRSGRVIRAYFNFTHNFIIFPTPAALDAAGRSFLP
jgi:hypothetical protein